MIICPDLWGENGQGKSSQIDDVMFNKVRSSKRKSCFLEGMQLKYWNSGLGRCFLFKITAA